MQGGSAEVITAGYQAKFVSLSAPASGKPNVLIEQRIANSPDDAPPALIVQKAAPAAQAEQAPKTQSFELINGTDNTDGRAYLKTYADYGLRLSEDGKRVISAGRNDDGLTLRQYLVKELGSTKARALMRGIRESLLLERANMNAMIATGETPEAEQNPENIRTNALQGDDVAFDTDEVATAANAPVQAAAAAVAPAQAKPAAIKVSKPRPAAVQTAPAAKPAVVAQAAKPAPVATEEKCDKEEKKAAAAAPAKPTPPTNGGGNNGGGTKSDFNFVNMPSKFVQSISNGTAQGATAKLINSIDPIYWVGGLMGALALVGIGAAATRRRHRNPNGKSMSLAGLNFDKTETAKGSSAATVEPTPIPAAPTETPKPLFVVQNYAGEDPEAQLRVMQERAAAYKEQVQAGFKALPGRLQKLGDNLKAAVTPKIKAVGIDELKAAASGEPKQSRVVKFADWAKATGAVAAANFGKLRDETAKRREASLARHTQPTEDQQTIAALRAEIAELKKRLEMFMGGQHEAPRFGPATRPVVKPDLKVVGGTPEPQA